MASDAGSDSSNAALSANEADPLYVPLNRFAFRRDVRVYAVMDGAMFDGLPGLLRGKNLSARSLYRDGTDEDWIESGPWLVDPYRLADGRDEEDDDEDDGYGAAVLPDNDVEEGDEELSQEELEDQADSLAARMQAALEDGDETGAGLLPPENPDPDDPRPFAKPVYPWPQVRAVLEIAEGSPGLVFWIGDANLTEPQLYRHLRTINQVQMPKAYADDEVASAAELPENMPDEDMPDEDGAWQAVQFRHADGNVLAEVMPVLYEPQFARLFGPARLLIFTAPDHPAEDGSILYEAQLPDDAPAATAGLLRLSVEQMEMIEETRLEQSRRETMEFLREELADETADLDDKALYALVTKIEGRGFALGLSTMTSHLLFAWIFVVSGPTAVDPVSFEQLRTEEGETPDSAMETVFDGFIEAAEKDERGEL